MGQWSICVRAVRERVTLSITLFPSNARILIHTIVQSPRQGVFLGMYAMLGVSARESAGPLVVLMSIVMMMVFVRQSCVVLGLCVRVMDAKTINTVKEEHARTSVLV